MKKLDIEYDYIVSIDCLSTEERQKHGITDSLKKQLQGLGLGYKAFLCDKRNSVLEVFDELIQCVKLGEKFMLNFIAHGNSSGIGVGGELLTWEEMSSKLKMINDSMGHGLVVNMTSCFGLYAVIANNFVDECPFFGLIGSSVKLKVTHGKLVNGMLLEKMASGVDIGEAVKLINNEIKAKTNKDYVIECISSEGYRKIKSTINTNT